MGHGALLGYVKGPGIPFSVLPDPSVSLWSLSSYSGHQLAWGRGQGVSPHVAPWCPSEVLHPRLPLWVSPSQQTGKPTFLQPRSFSVCYTWS